MIEVQVSEEKDERARMGGQWVLSSASRISHYPRQSSKAQEVLGGGETFITFRLLV